MLSTCLFICSTFFLLVSVNFIIKINIFSEETLSNKKKWKWKKTNLVDISWINLIIGIQSSIYLLHFFFNRLQFFIFLVFGKKSSGPLNSVYLALFPSICLPPLVYLFVTLFSYWLYIIFHLLSSLEKRVVDHQIRFIWHFLCRFVYLHPL